jgi:lipopolysaccharide export LptBFGC system permease protein LptF
MECYKGNKNWAVRNGLMIINPIYSMDKNIKISTFDSINTSLLPGPDEIFIEKLKDANSYSIYDLIIRTSKLKKLSLNPVYELVYIYFKLSMIFLNFTVVLVAFIIAQTSLIKNKSLSISIALLVSLLMWALLIVSKRLGDLELVSPSMVLIIPHMIFMIISAAVMYRKKMI